MSPWQRERTTEGSNKFSVHAKENKTTVSLRETEKEPGFKGLNQLRGPDQDANDGERHEVKERCEGEAVRS